MMWVSNALHARKILISTHNRKNWEDPKCYGSVWRGRSCCSLLTIRTGIVERRTHTLTHTYAPTHPLLPHVHSLFHSLLRAGGPYGAVILFNLFDHSEEKKYIPGCVRLFSISPFKSCTPTDVSGWILLTCFLLGICLCIVIAAARRPGVPQ